MPKYDLSKRIVNGELSRRQMLKGLGAAGVLSTTVPLLPKTALQNNKFSYLHGVDTMMKVYMLVT